MDGWVDEWVGGWMDDGWVDDSYLLIQHHCKLLVSDAGLGGASIGTGIWNYVQVDPLQDVLLEETHTQTHTQHTSTGPNDKQMVCDQQELV